MHRAYCSKSWTDINIDFQERTLRHCCKSKKYNFPDNLTQTFFNNSQQITQRRSDTLNNLFHDDCNFCWNNYRLGKNSYRDFMNVWTEEYISKNVIDDSYLCNIEIKFDNTCDMSCLYCDAKSSSKISSEENIKIENNFKNQDYEIFKQWLTSYLMRDDLKSTNIFIIILGGEPTLSKKFFDFVKFIEEIKYKISHLNIQIGVITNANSNKFLINRFLQLIEQSNIKWFIIISNESIDQNSVHVRDGIIWQNFENNLIEYLSHKKIETISFLPSINALAVKTFPNYLEYINRLVLQYGHNKKILWNGNYIEYPTALDVSKLPIQYNDYIKQSKAIMRQYKDKINFIQFENFLNFLTFVEDRIGKEYNDNYKIDIQLFLENKSRIKNKKHLLQLINEL